MYFAGFVLSVVVWIVSASLGELLRRHHPWRAAALGSAQATLLRGLREVRFGLQVVAWASAVLALLGAGRQFLAGQEVWGVALVLVAAMALQGMVHQRGFQVWLLSGLARIARQWGSKLRVVRGVLGVLNTPGRWFFPETPLFADTGELRELVRHHHRSHQVLDARQQHQLETLLKADGTTIERKIIPLKKAAMVKATDTIGPLLLSELHDCPYGVFAVYENRRSTIVGMLDQGVALSHAKGNTKVASMMEERIVYLPPDTTYRQALATFIETSSVLSVIIDENKRPTGVLYVQDILRDLFGAEEETL